MSVKLSEIQLGRIVMLITACACSPAGYITRLEAKFVLGGPRARMRHSVRHALIRGYLRCEDGRFTATPAGLALLEPSNAQAD